MHHLSAENSAWSRYSKYGSSFRWEKKISSTFDSVFSLKMYKNKEERIELIAEMRSTHALQEQDIRKKILERQDIQAAQHFERKEIQRVKSSFSSRSENLSFSRFSRKTLSIRFYKISKAKEWPIYLIIFRKN